HRHRHQHHKQTADGPADVLLDPHRNKQGPHADADQQDAAYGDQVFQAHHHDLVDAQPRQGPAHPHHHEDEQPALEDEDRDIDDVADHDADHAQAQRLFEQVGELPRDAEAPAAEEHDASDAAD